jgi:cytochrome c peroxidase
MLTYRSLAAGAMTLAAVAALIGLGAPGIRSEAQAPEPIVIPQSLKTVSVPEPPNLSDFVRNRAAAVRLGKALFWDMQVGSDGVQACASCHFRAGADSRLKNQLSPGLLGGDTSFHAGTGPNYTLKLTDFPFHMLQNVNDRHSNVLSDRNDVASSQGVVGHTFDWVNPTNPVDGGTLFDDQTFFVGTSKTRRVEPRNTPTVINAVFNFRNFWDGRAQWDFNGVNPFGSRDPDARVWKVLGGTIKRVKIRLLNASLASQAVGPPLSPFEMSWDGRSFRHLGRKLLGEPVGLIPLGRQIVHPQDSALGALANSRIAPTKKGLNSTYAQMIREAFHFAWWNSNKVVRFDAAGNVVAVMDAPQGPLPDDTFTLMEVNFSLFFGIAIQMYEATLVADDTPLDRFLEGYEGSLTKQQLRGWQIFLGKGKCINCHGGPELTNASVDNVRGERLERMIMGNNREAIYDNGFYNIGVRPTAEDVGVGGLDPFGNPLSDTRMAFLGLFFDPNLDPPLGPGDKRAAVDGAFKAPGLRNVELTAPYFHNGGQALLSQVVEFYNRGSDFADENIKNLDPDIQPLGLTIPEQKALVAFLKALTDPRVRFEKAPFDHPQLFIPNGHLGNELGCVDDGTGQAKDGFRQIKAVGADGSYALRPVFPQ